MRFEFLYQVLSRIEERAEMYLGERDLFRLELFVEGYYAALRDAGVVPRALDTWADADMTARISCGGRRRTTLVSSRAKSIGTASSTLAVVESNPGIGRVGVKYAGEHDPF